MQSYQTYIAPKQVIDPRANIGATANSANDNKAKVHKAAGEFEAMFISEMLKPMFDGESVSNQEFGGGKSEKIYQSMLVDQYSKQIAKAGGIGIAKNIEKELLKLQEKK